MKKTDILVWLLLCGLAVGAAFALKQCRRTLPESQCSEVYRRYAHVPGVEAAFVKGFPINDTVAVDVTLLHATDSAGWAFLVDTFHISKDRIKRAKVMPDYRVFEWQVVRGQPETKAVLKGINRIPNLTKDDVELCICDFQEKEISIFHAQNAKEIDAIRNYNFDKMTNKKITNDEDKKN